MRAVPAASWRMRGLDPSLPRSRPRFSIDGDAEGTERPGHVRRYGPEVSMAGLHEAFSDASVEP